MCVDADASDLFCIDNLANIERFHTIPTFDFKHQILYTCKLASMS